MSSFNLPEMRQPLFRPGVPMRLRLLGRLNRIFDKEPGSILALRLQAPGGLQWRIADGLLTLSRPSQPDYTLALAGRRIVDVRDILAAEGFQVLYYADDPAILTLGALALMPGKGDQGQSNGDHLYAFTSPLWAWTGSVGRWLDEARRDIPLALREMVVPTSNGEWSELWASYFGLRRRIAEVDSHLNMRTAYEWRRPRSNRFAIQQNIKVLHGKDVTVREPWREMWTLDESSLSGDHHLPNATEFCYHFAQLRSPEFLNWEPIQAEAEADRPVGTLFLSPVTHGQAQHLVFDHPPQLGLSGVGMGSWSVKDYDGHILDFNCSLSDTYVLLNPVMAVYDSRSIRIENFQDPGEFVPALTICIGEIVPSEAPPLGELQAHLAGGRKRVESGDPMSLSGAEPLDDYAWSLTWGPIDRWIEAVLAASNAAPEYPLQRLLGSIEIRGAGIEAEPEGQASTREANLSRHSTTNLSIPRVYDRGWRGRWDGRTWRAAGFPTPTFSEKMTTELLTTDFQAFIFGRALSSAELTAQAKFDGAMASSHSLASLITTEITLGVDLQTAPAMSNPELFGQTLFATNLVRSGLVETNLTTGIPLAGAMAAESSLAGQPQTEIVLSASLAAETTLNVPDAIPIQASLVAEASIAPNFQAKALFVATLAAEAAISNATLDTKVRFGANLAGQAAAAGDLSASMRLAASLAGEASATGSLEAISFTIFGTTAPSVTDSYAPTVVATKIRTSRSGQVTALRWYKPSGTTQTSIKLWTSGGTELASVAVSTSAPTGWNEVTLATPVSIAAGLYVVSVFNSGNSYGATPALFTGKAITSGPLTAPADGGADGGNGLYDNVAASHVFPTYTYQGEGYHVDFRFV